MSEKATMVHALREEPGTYTRDLGDDSEVLYWIRPEDGGFIAGWEHRITTQVTGGSTGSTREVGFASYADAVKFLEENFDVPLEER